MSDPTCTAGSILTAAASSVCILPAARCACGGFDCKTCCSQLCVLCFKAGTNKCRCGRHYCSRACQLEDWSGRGHKRDCRRLMRERAAAAAPVAALPRVDLRPIPRVVVAKAKQSDAWSWARPPRYYSDEDDETCDEVRDYEDDEEQANGCVVPWIAGDLAPRRRQSSQLAYRVQLQRARIAAAVRGPKQKLRAAGGLLRAVVSPSRRADPEFNVVLARARRNLLGDAPPAPREQGAAPRRLASEERREGGARLRLRGAMILVRLVVWAATTARRRRQETERAEEERNESGGRAARGALPVDDAACVERLRLHRQHRADTDADATACADDHVLLESWELELLRRHEIRLAHASDHRERRARDSERDERLEAQQARIARTMQAHAAEMTALKEQRARNVKFALAPLVTAAKALDLELVWRAARRSRFCAAAHRVSLVHVDQEEAARDQGAAAALADDAPRGKCDAVPKLLEEGERRRVRRRSGTYEAEQAPEPWREATEQQHKLLSSTRSAAPRDSLASIASWRPRRAIATLEPPELERRAESQLQ